MKHKTTALERRRRKAKLSPAALAVAAGVSERTVLNHEARRDFKASPTTVTALAMALKVSERSLFRNGYVI